MTDNEGWRIEIEKVGRTGAGRVPRWTGACNGAGPQGSRCFGFYTQDEIRQLVRYAADRHITVVPKIEMPYHTGAAIVAYPELGMETGRLAELPPEQRWDKSEGPDRAPAGDGHLLSGCAGGSDGPVPRHAHPHRR